MTRFLIKNIHSNLLLMQRCIMGFVTVIISVLIFIQVFIRYFLDIPLSGVEQIAAYLAVWLYFIGSGYGVYKGNHISASVMDLLLSNKRCKDIFQSFVSMLTLILVCWVFLLCLDYFQWSLKRLPKSPELRLPLYYVHFAMVFGLGLMVFYSIIETIRRFIYIKNHEDYVSLFKLDTNEKNKIDSSELS